MHLLFVVNPISGGKTKKRFLTHLHRYITGGIHSYELYFTTKSIEVDSERLVEILEMKTFHRVVAVGGDGTVRLVARNIVHRDIGMGIVPFGSANGMARELEIPHSPITALEQAVESERVKLLDILLVNEQYYCFHLADIGANALLVNKHHNEKGRGWLGYAKNILSSIRETEQFKSYLLLDDEKIKLEGYNLTIANARKYGIGTVINTVGKIDDGLFEVVLLKQLNSVGLIKCFCSVFDETMIQPLTEVHSTHSAVILFSSPQPFHIDGEPMANVSRLSIRILSKAIQFYK